MREMIGIAVMALLVSATPSHAYIGPGLGLGAIGAVLGIVLSVFLAIVAIFWYPLKRMLGLGKRRPNTAQPAAEGKTSNPPDA